MKSARLYPDFPWVSVAQLYPEEFRASVIAMETAGNSRYYRYRQDLGPVRSTLYRNILWVGKELLIRINGEGNFSQYHGWLSVPKEQVSIERIGNDYIAQRGAA